MARLVTVTLRRPLQGVGWREDEPFSSIVVPAGTTITIPFYPGASVYSEEPYAEVGHRGVLYASARVPCADLESDYCGCSEYCNHGSWFCCGRFDQGDAGLLAICQGDKCRCPSSRVRAEARSLLVNEEVERRG